jgi:uncharacterized membrane protein YccC
MASSIQQSPLSSKPVGDASSTGDRKPLQAMWQLLTHVDRSKINVPQALRNTFGVVAPLIVGQMLGMPRGGLAMASGALNVSYSDGSDPYAKRAKRMLASTVWCSIAVLLGGLTAHGNVVSVVAATAWAFIAGMLVALGTTAADVGVISTVVLVIYAAQPLSASQALQAAGLALCGGVLQILLSVALWPVRRYEPERRSLATLYTELARMATHPSEAAAAPLATREIAAAHDALSNLATDTSVPALRLRSLLSQAERIRLSLTTLARLRHRLARENAYHPAMAALDQYRENTAHLLDAVANSLSPGNEPGAEGDRLISGMALAQKLAPNSDAAMQGFAAAALRDVKFQVDALGGQLRAAFELARNTTPEGQAAFDKTEAEQPLRLRFTGRIATLRANLTLNSVVCRHAIRLMACVAVGDALGRYLHPYRAYWIPMTIVLVLKPEFVVTFSRGVLRIAGTLAGLLLATALFHFLPIHTATEIALVGVFMFLMRWVGPANYGIFAVAVSALVVLLIAITGTAPKEVIQARAVNTVLGGAFALAAYLAWPSWERNRLPELFVTLLEAYRKSFAVIGKALMEPGAETARERDRTRQAGRTARSNLEAALERLAAEPGITQVRLAQINAMVASSHRFAHAMMALEASVQQASKQAPRREFREFAAAVDKILELLGKKAVGHKVAEREFPDLREIYSRLAVAGDPGVARYALTNVEADRMTNSLNTLREQVFAWRRYQAGHQHNEKCPHPSQSDPPVRLHSVDSSKKL